MCVMAMVAMAPCQCFSPGGNQITSPGRISSIGPSQRCARPPPAVTMSVCPRGCVCHAVRAPGSNVTLAPRTRAGSGVSNSGSIRTVPVNQSAGPSVETCEPLLLIFMYEPLQDGLRGPSCRAVALRVGGCLNFVNQIFLSPSSISHLPSSLSSLLLTLRSELILPLTCRAVALCVGGSFNFHGFKRRRCAIFSQLPKGAWLQRTFTLSTSQHPCRAGLSRRSFPDAP